jgi:hypothetical protein
MRRLLRPILLAFMIYLWWPAMMAVHELGHVINIALSGGKLARVRLHWLAFTQTDVAINPHPAFVAWGGVWWGTLIPLLATALWQWRKWPLWPVIRVFAAFCLVANGAYLGAGWRWKSGDAGDLRDYGTPVWAMIALGAAMIAAGLWLWNGMGKHFGIDRAALKPTRKISEGTPPA